MDTAEGGQYHIHGDNIVECERTLSLIELALSSRSEGSAGSPTCPIYKMIVGDPPKLMTFTLYPGFGRWRQDILQLVRKRGGVLREAVDAIVTRVVSGVEDPIVAIEYCGALPAGNQAWQRNGRAYSYGLAGIPYLYVAELGGYELNAQRERKSPRLPNPAVPFSYLSFSLSRDTPVLPIFKPNPGASYESKQEYGDVLVGDELHDLIRAMILYDDISSPFESLREKVIAFVRLRAASAQVGNTMTPEQWTRVYETVESRGSLVDSLITDAPMRWAKKSYIAGLTESARKLMILTEDLAIGLTSSNLPMCIIPPRNRPRFAATLESLYEKLPRNFVDWVSQEEPLAIAWVMGFKPKGDDARPDRGLPPMARMLVGDGLDILSVIYGPAPPDTWSMLLENPSSLAQQNGLWEAIMEVSNGILVDSKTDNETNHGLLRKHWSSAIPEVDPNYAIYVEPCPTNIGEHDVDTVLHTLFGRLGGDQVFEGLCNPPGGDWSGISLQSSDRQLELRWLSLPRESGKDAKRPDHIFQVFHSSDPAILLAVESKDRPKAMEKRVGPRLKTYISKLVQSIPSIQRHRSDAEWTQSDYTFDVSDFTLVSAVAFLSSDAAEISKVKRSSEADLSISLIFASDGTSCKVVFSAGTTIGRRILRSHIQPVAFGGAGITVDYQ